MKKIILFILMSTGLAGCAIGWDRPNTSNYEYQQDHFECQQQATQMYPVLRVTKEVSPGYQGPSETVCTDYGYQVRCTTTSGTKYPPITTTEDANSINRIQALNACLTSKGYQFKMEFK